MDTAIQARLRHDSLGPGRSDILSVGFLTQFQLSFLNLEWELTKGQSPDDENGAVIGRGSTIWLLCSKENQGTHHKMAL